jgi:Transmembrane secretion effector
VYLGVLSGLSTVVQLAAPAAYRGRVISFFQVALGVSYPVGALLQGPLADAVGVGWTTAGSAVVLALVTLIAWFRWPHFTAALLGTRQVGPGAEAVSGTSPDMAR